MMKKLPLVLAVAVATFATGARADVPPPDGYVEECTVEKKEQPGTDCKACPNNPSNPQDYCAQQVGAGYTKVCNSYGASVWTEVWCNGPPRPAEEESGGCSLGRSPSEGGVPWLGTALAAMAWILARRRR